MAREDRKLREDRIILAIDTALDTHRAKLSNWEINFFNGVRDQHRKKGTVSVKQKDIIIPVLVKLGVWKGGD